MAVKTDIEFDPAEVLLPGSSHEAPSYARDLLVAVHECPVPIIAAINGPAVGFGFELALAADIGSRPAALRFPTSSFVVRGSRWFGILAASSYRDLGNGPRSDPFRASNRRR